jgi:hypothetical protein
MECCCACGRGVDSGRISRESRVQGGIDDPHNERIATAIHKVLLDGLAQVGLRDPPTPPS